MFYEPSLPTISHKLYSVLFNFQILIKIFCLPLPPSSSFSFFCYSGFFLCSPLTPVGLVDCIYFIYIPLSPISHHLYVSHIFCSFFSFFCFSGFFSAVHWQSHLQENDSCRLSGLLAVVIEKQVLQRQKENEIFDEKKTKES